MIKKLVGKLLAVVYPISSLNRPEATEQYVARLLAIPLENLLPGQYSELSSLHDVMTLRANYWSTAGIPLPERMVPTNSESLRVQKLTDALAITAEYVSR